MKRKIGIVYSTIDGQTLKICERIAEKIQEAGFKVELFEISSFDNDILDYSAFIIGASIRYGKHHKRVTRFVLDNCDELAKINTAFFSVNLVARKTDKNTRYTNPYVVKYLSDLDWDPGIIEVFAGKLDYNAYSFMDKIMIKLIMKMTKGPIKSDVPIEFTDWSRVDNFSQLLVTEIE